MKTIFETNSPLSSSCSRNTTASNQLNAAPSYENDRRLICEESIINKTALFVSIGVVASLLLVFIIITSIRCVYKPLRPRIKKTYVVHKNVTPTPLTCRPATEQCEITIENCCNMNICDTVSTADLFFPIFSVFVFAFCHSAYRHRTPIEIAYS